MSNQTYAYPFDPTGTLSSNRITGELQIISPPNWSDFYFIVPLAAPFFRESLVVTYTPNGGPATIPLVEGQHYSATHRFHDASLATAHPIYGSLTFMDKTLAGVISLTYQTIGGEWTVMQEVITEILSNKLSNPRITTWEEVAELPHEFPIIDHPWDLVDMVGASDIVTAIYGIRDAIADGSGGSSALALHIADTDNPHGTDKNDVGLGNVQNYPVASQSLAEGGLSNITYMTPLRTAQAITALVGTALANHVNNQDNPHGTDKEDVGLGNVQNFGVSTQQQAEQGALNNVYMTPLRTAQAIAIAIAAVVAHVSRTDNPHGTDKEDVGLGNVPNYPAAGQVDAEEGTNNASFMTPLRTAQAITALVNLAPYNAAAAHVSQTGNVHSMTKAQIELGNVDNFATADQETAEAGSSPSHFMTPLGVKQQIDAGVGANLQDFIDTQTASTQALVDARPGDLLFGQNPSNVYQDNVGQLQQWVNVSYTVDDVAVLEAFDNSLSVELGDWNRTSMYAAVNRRAEPNDLDGWYFSTTTSKIARVDTTTTLAALTAPEPRVNYTFEVLMTSTDADDQAMGVCAAFMTYQGKDYGIYALRTPGGLVLDSEVLAVPGGDIYKLFTVGYNLFQNDAVDLGSTNTGLTWGDGVEDADRGTAGPYVSGATGWDLNGTCRIRVTRTGDTIEIETTQFDSTDYGLGAVVTIDLTSLPALEVFRGPTSYGPVVYKQPEARFGVLNRPDAFMPYVLKLVGADGVNASTYHYHNGAAWVSIPLNLSNPYIKPGRMYCSTFNQHVFFACRDGTLRPVHIALNPPPPDGGGGS